MLPRWIATTDGQQLFVVTRQQQQNYLLALLISDSDICDVMMQYMVTYKQYSTSQHYTNTLKPLGL